MEELARTVLLDPIRVRIGDANAATTDVEQRLMYVGNEMGKLLAMRQLIQVCTLLLTTPFHGLNHKHSTWIWAI